MEQENPYSALLGVIRKDNEEHKDRVWCFGQIRSMAPLSVEVSGEVVTQGIYINPLLLGRQGQAKISGISGKLLLSGENETVSGGELSGRIEIGAAIAVGDRVVVLMSQDGQELVILCRAVKT